LQPNPFMNVCQENKKEKEEEYEKKDEIKTIL
jgi:hypothetical protein